MQMWLVQTYLQDETEEEHEEEGHDDHGGLIKADYLQKMLSYRV